VAASGSTIDSRSGKRLIDATRRSRMKWLGVLFQQLQLKGEPAELWQLAGSQASFALARNDTRTMAQCFSWMAVAALAGKHFEAARQQAEDAILFAQISKDQYREGFASVYLGHAQRQLGQDTEALKSYLVAVERLANSETGRIHVVAMLSAAQLAEALRPADETKPLYESARTMAMGLNQLDLKVAAEAGLARLSSPPTG
jgi:hypothetical protein